MSSIAYKPISELEHELFLIEPNLEVVGDRRDRAEQRDSVFRRLLGISDLLATTLALVATAEVTNTTAVYWSMFAAVLVAVPLIKMMGLYDRDANVLNKTTLDETPGLLSVAMMIAVAAFIARDLMVIGEPGIGSEQLVFLWLCLFTFLGTGRVAARRIASLSTPVERLLVIGGPEECANLNQKIALSPSVRALVIGRVPISAHELPYGPSRVLGKPSDLRKIVNHYDIDRLIIVPDAGDPEELSDVVRAVKSIGVKISILPRLFDAIGHATVPDDIGGVELMGVRDFKMTSSSQMIKRGLDVAVALFGLLVVSPLLAVAAVAIKLDSRGPVFYKQTRIGRDGESFEIVKFRSMRVGADSERKNLDALNETSGLFKMAKDPRITRVGGLLRKTSMDELPQLINVVRGDMSLVGPRPLIPEEDQNITGWYRRRSHITPGITGAWQLLGPVRIPMEEMVKLDYLYVANWSLWVDLKIMLRTIPHVLARRGL